MCNIKSRMAAGKSININTSALIGLGEVANGGFL